MNQKTSGQRRNNHHHHFFIGHNLILMVLIIATVSSVLVLSDTTEDTSSASQSASIISAYGADSDVVSDYLTSWHNFGPGGGGFTTDIRVAPAGFFNLGKESRVYLSNDINGVFRSSELKSGRGAVIKWEHLWNPVVNTMVEMPTKYVSSIAFSLAYDNQSVSRVISGTREGIFTYAEDSKSWSLVNSMPKRADLERLGLQMQNEDGIYPWVSVIREVPWSSNFLTAGIGDHRESYTLGARRFGQSSVMRSRDGGRTWDLVRLPSTDNEEVVFDIKYLKSADFIGVFIVTDKDVYSSKNFFSSDTPQIYSIWNNSAVQGGKATGLSELRSAEVLPRVEAAEDSDMLKDSARIFVVVHSDTSSLGGVYEAAGLLFSSSSKNSLVWSKNTMDSGKSERYLGRIIKTEDSTADNYKLYISKFNNPYLLVKTNIMSSWQTIVNDSSSYDSAYEADPKRSAFGMIEAAPLELSQTKEPTILGAWSFGPIFAPGHDGEVTKKRAYVQMFSYKHHDLRATEFFGSRGFDEINFIGSVPEIKPREPNTIMLAAPDNGILLSHDYGKTWSVRTPRSPADWSSDYETTLVAGYQVRFHPVNTQCVIASVGPNRFGFGKDNLGELVVNQISGYGDADSWQTFAGGSAELNGLPNAEIHAMTFDPQSESDGSVGLFVGVRGYGLYFGKVASDCTLKNGENFRRIDSSKVSALISPDAGYHHYYSQLIFDPEDQNILYVARSYPGGGVFRLKLEKDFSLRGAEPVSFDEIILGLMSENGVEYCPINRGQNRYRTADVNYIAVTKTHIIAALGYGLSPDAEEKNERCKPDPLLSVTRAVNSYGGLVRVSKNAPIKNGRFSGINEWILGGPDNVGSLPMSIFQVGAVAVNPARQNEIVAITTGGRFPVNRTQDGIVEGEEDARVAGLFVSKNSGTTFSFHPWAFKFPNALSMKFSDNGRRLFVPTRGNSLWVWQSPR